MTDIENQVDDAARYETDEAALSELHTSLRMAVASRPGDVQLRRMEKTIERARVQLRHRKRQDAPLIASVVAELEAMRSGDDEVDALIDEAISELRG
jgi:ubiquinone biosynthesis protein UbiJ